MNYSASIAVPAWAWTLSADALVGILLLQENGTLVSASAAT
ncbi:hypothetical protein [Streptomyces sp. B21-101]